MFCYMSTTDIKLCRLCSFFIVLNNNFELNMGNKKFYKFRKCDDRYFESLRKGTIYFSSLQDLNDPFEGKFSLGETCVIDANNRLQNKMNRRLVFSMAEDFGNENFVKDNHLMWTHYADQHRGFCIEYNENILMGDANSDGKITSNDARLILRFSAKLEKFTEKQKEICDINKDGSVNASDARIALRLSAKLV